jgi:hypothetical protein
MVDIRNWPVMDRPPVDAAMLWRTQAGWLGSQLSVEHWTLTMPETLASSIRAFASAKRMSAPEEVIHQWNPPGDSNAFVDRVERILEGGLGFCLIKGLQVAPDERELQLGILLFSTLFGRPVSQTRKGNIVARVENLGLDLADPNVRGHQTRAELTYHCDRADRVILYCVRTARSGGESRVISAIKLAEDLAARCPEVAMKLSSPLPQDRRGEEFPGELPWCNMPIFNKLEGVFVARYLRRFIEDSSRHVGAPRLDFDTIRALDALDAMMEEGGRAVEMTFSPGDIQLVNNNVIFHSRTAFNDDPDPGRRRLLLRVWLSHRSGRPLPPSFATLYARTAAGKYRGGVWPVPTSVTK